MNNNTKARYKKLTRKARGQMAANAAPRRLNKYGRPFAKVAASGRN